ncbi:MAG: carbohydrate kinase family protein [Anaerolineales bacterium]|jgi:hypothetical protein
MVPRNPSPRDVFVGELRREYILSTNQEWIIDSPGGSALYAAGGYLVWEKEYPPGLSTRVGEDFPRTWLEDFSERNIETGGVIILPQPLDLRSCIIQEGGSAWETSRPVPHLTRLGASLPPGLVGLPDRTQELDTRRDRTPAAIHETDIPEVYLAATGVHFCPLDYLSHNLLPAVFRQRGYTTLTLDPGSSYLDPSYYGDVPALVTGLTAFLPSEAGLRKLYKGVSNDLWEMAADLGHYGCEFVVIRGDTGGQYLYEQASERRWEIGPYPARVRNPFGSGDAFCGGFLIGYRRSFDPLEAVCCGSVAASLAVEGSGPFYPLGALPGLADARLEVVRDLVREV